MAKVHARYILLKNKTTGVDPLVDKILSDQKTALLYERARNIYNSKIKKSYVEACLMSTSDLSKIEELIEVPPEVLEMYRDVFFDIVGFDKLSLLEVIEDSDSFDERCMKIWALNQGLDFIAWRLGKVITVNPVEGLQELFTLSTYKSKEALFSNNASESSKAATIWTKLSMDLARLLKSWVSNTDVAKSDIEFALKNINPEFEGFDSLN